MVRSSKIFSKMTHFSITHLVKINRTNYTDKNDTDLRFFDRFLRNRKFGSDFIYKLQKENPYILFVVSDFIKNFLWKIIFFS